MPLLGQPLRGPHLGGHVERQRLHQAFGARQPRRDAPQPARAAVRPDPAELGRPRPPEPGQPTLLRIVVRMHAAAKLVQSARARPVGRRLARDPLRLRVHEQRLVGVHVQHGHDRGQPLHHVVVAVLGHIQPEPDPRVRRVRHHHAVVPHPADAAVVAADPEDGVVLLAPLGGGVGPGAVLRQRPLVQELAQHVQRIRRQPAPGRHARHPLGLRADVAHPPLGEGRLIAQEHRPRHRVDQMLETGRLLPFAAAAHRRMLRGRATIRRLRPGAPRRAPSAVPARLPPTCA